ncbi:hypothetical protein J8281_12660 [Aquimarina sp. U1-2]|uniref:DUF6090 family protein n=1 Tax=Aquimarina sp. U1-2 TaxID=2823141 RepID=UPI001AECE572|nr:DUF6090 family protein [Aquimarina sp. U1-2]MBP2833040.1 hypothetical protein [Aquimarina sp. U1-2]
MLIDNKFSKYLIYAIGEIILVVIGILIALQINNASNYKKQRKIEQKYLLLLESEFKNNLTKVNNEIQENQQRIDAVNEMVPLFDKSISDTVSNQTIFKLFSKIFGTSLNYEPSNGVLTDILSSGKLDLFQNERLREHLASFESSMGFYKQQESVANSIKTDLQKLYYKKGSVRNIMKSFGSEFEHQSISENTNVKEIFESIEFENYLLDYYMTIVGANNDNYLSGLKKEIEGILHEIKEDQNK